MSQEELDQQSKLEKVHNVFEKVSPGYDKMNAVISFQLHKGWRKETMDDMMIVQGAKALDVCCGTADWTLSMAEAVGEEGEVIGFDFSANMLAEGQKKVDASSFENIRLIEGNAMELPFEDNSFDYVTIGFGLRNVPDYLTVLKEINRVLKPGGLFACLETSQPTLPVYRQLYFGYFKYVMPLFGRVFAKSYKEYAWLNDSTRLFPDKERLAQLLVKAGFVAVTYKSFSGGAAATHMGVKKS